MEGLFEMELLVQSVTFSFSQIRPNVFSLLEDPFLLAWISDGCNLSLATALVSHKEQVCGISYNHLNKKSVFS